MDGDGSCVDGRPGAVKDAVDPVRRLVGECGDPTIPRGWLVQRPDSRRCHSSLQSRQGAPLDLWYAG